MRDVFEVKMITSRSEKCVGVSRCYYSPHILAEAEGEALVPGCYCYARVWFVLSFAGKGGGEYFDRGHI
jgi:hypothetical protein